MREAIWEFVTIVARTLPVAAPIYEFGSLLIPGQERVADLRPLFPGKAYVGVDMREGPGVDLVLDLHDIALPDGAAGTVLCCDTIEHVKDPRRAVEEIRRITAPGGMAVVGAPMNFPVHNFPSDYWRFTPEGLKLLLAPFPGSFVGHYGSDDFPSGVVGLGFTGAAPSMDAFMAAYGAWQARHRCGPQGGEPALKRAARACVPPLVWSLLAAAFRAAKGRE